MAVIGRGALELGIDARVLADTYFDHRFGRARAGSRPPNRQAARPRPHRPSYWSSARSPSDRARRPPPSSATRHPSSRSGASPQPPSSSPARADESPSCDPPASRSVELIAELFGGFHPGDMGRRFLRSWARPRTSPSFPSNGVSSAIDSLLWFATEKHAHTRHHRPQSRAVATRCV
jgi:hypothetical protein